MTHYLMHILGLTAVCSLALQTALSGDTSAANSDAAAMSRDRACEPSTDLLSADATLSDRAGRYSLTLVVDLADSAGTSRRVVSGLLTLRRQTRDSDAPDAPYRLRDVSTPLYGFTDIDPGSVGAHRVGDPGSKDPEAPGVLVLERSEYGRRVITLRLGSDANRKDVVRYDGAYTALKVRRIVEDGFTGSWRSGGGLDWSRSITTGYFCAWKVPESE